MRVNHQQRGSHTASSLFVRLFKVPARMLATRAGICGRVIGFAMVCALATGAGHASAAPIFASAAGSTQPGQQPAGNVVVNGDFKITGNPGAVGPVGDGFDEVTTWQMDFTGDANFAGFPTGGVLTGAELRIGLTPKGGNFTDFLQIAGLGNVFTTDIQGLSTLPNGSIHDVTLNLLDFFTAADIVGQLGVGGGVLNMTYIDDAIISFAELTLTDVSVPEPSPLGLLALAGLLAVLQKSRNKRT